jgi:hypothetical protein
MAKNFSSQAGGTTRQSIDALPGYCELVCTLAADLNQAFIVVDDPTEHGAHLSQRSVVAVAAEARGPARLAADAGSPAQASAQ